MPCERLKLGFQLNSPKDDGRGLLYWVGSKFADSKEYAEILPYELGEDRSFSRRSDAGVKEACFSKLDDGVSWAGSG